MKASQLSFRAAVLLMLAGMLWGLFMAVTGDHSAAPAHAHLNLLGFVALFLFGVYYHLHPALDRSGLAMAQVMIWIASAAVMAIGVGMIHTGRMAGEPLAAISSIAALLDMALFAWLVYGRSGADHAAGAVAAPAE